MRLRDVGGAGILFLLGFILSGCNVELKSKTYYGVIWAQKNSSFQSLNQEKVLLQFSPDSDDGGTLKIYSYLKPDQEVFSPLKLVHFKKNSFVLNIPELQIEESFRLVRQKPPAQNCFKGDGTYQAWFCTEASRFTLDVEFQGSPVLYLVADPIEATAKVTYELPRVLTISHAIELALLRNAEVLTDREMLKQAQEKARKAYLELIPHLNPTNTANLATAAMNPFTPWTIYVAMGSAGDFVPFLLPSRWLEARSYQWQFQAAEMANILLKANIASSVQTIMISYLAHQKQIEHLTSLKSHLKPALSHCTEEEYGIIQDSIRSIELASLQAGNQAHRDKSQLAQILGLNNPSEIVEIERGQEVLSFDHLTELNEVELDAEKKRYSEIAVLNSFEIRQQQYLREASVHNSKSVAFNWLDVTHHPGTSLGASLLSDYKIGKSMINLIDIQLMKTRSLLETKVYDTLANRNYMLGFERVIKERLNYRRGRIEHIADVLMQRAPSSPQGSPYFQRRTEASPTQLNLGPLHDDMADFLSALNSYHSSRAAAEMDQAHLDRVTLQGPYHRLFPHLKEFTFDRHAAKQLRTKGFF